MPEDKVQKELDKGGNLSIISLVDHLIEYAHEVRASDIHIDPTEKAVNVRLRIDGVLQDTHEIPKEIHSEVISRIKILAGLRTDEHQTAQDGRFRNVIEDVGPIDVRVSVIPTYHGENAVLRLLADKSESSFTLEALGFSKEDTKKITHAISKPYGMILATGPTGAGKTTTLYTLVKMLNKKEVSIITIEDPIEYAVKGIEQIQVNPRTGLTFASGLRSVLRQDPDIIMVGEIRDSETAGLAVNTALTGHLLFSTLHTNDSATTLPRLLDMHIESFLVASTVNVAIAQRLVRKICTHCKAGKKVTDAEAKSLREFLPNSKIKIDSATFYHGKGCNKCNDTGYFGRIGIYEVLVVDDQIREAFLRRASSTEIKQLAVKNGMTTMIEDGLVKAMHGLTTLEEILRVTHE